MRKLPVGQNGFTLLELVVVVVAIIFLVVLVFLFGS